MKERYSIKDSCLSFILAIVIPNVLAFLFLIIAGVFTDIAVIEKTKFYKIFATTLSQISFALIFFFIVRKNKVPFKQSIEKNGMSFKQVFIIILLSLVCLFLISPIINVIDSFLVSKGISEQTLSISLSSPRNFIYLVLTLGIFAPIAEELLFRGIIFNGLKNKSEKTAVIISALFFMLMHLSIHQTVYQFILGIILALVVLYTNNIFSAILLHFINNTAVLTINYINPQFFDFNFLSRNYIILAIILFIIAIIFVYGLIKWLRKLKKPDKKVIDENMNLVEDKKPKSDPLILAVIFGITMWILTVIMTL